MIRLPKYGRNIRRYADAAFGAAWREAMALTVEQLRDYYDDGNLDCAVSFDVQLKFGKSGLIGATAKLLAPVPDSGFRVTGSLIYPLRASDPQRQRWHAEIYRAAAMRYAVERYGPAIGRRPLFSVADAEVEAMAELPLVFDPDPIRSAEQRCHQFVARQELDHRARESNHARLERLGAAMKARK